MNFIANSKQQSKQRIINKTKNISSYYLPTTTTTTTTSNTND